MYAILDAAKAYDIKNIYIHPITDGRDTSVTSGVGFLKEITEKIEGTNAKIADICGRVYAMDREQRYDRLEKAYNLYVRGQGEKFENGGRKRNLRGRSFRQHRQKTRNGAFR
jgi:2,3-bisphosphoglycerate-independent phosphoglycerate mutase